MIQNLKSKLFKLLFDSHITSKEFIKDYYQIKLLINKINQKNLIL